MIILLLINLPIIVSWWSDVLKCFALSEQQFKTQRYFIYNSDKIEKSSKYLHLRDYKKGVFAISA